MACEEAFSRKHSAVSERQNQHQNQKAFAAKDAEHAKENKQNKHQHQEPFTTEGTEDTEKVNADEQDGVKQRAEALALKLAQAQEELAMLLEENPGLKRQFTDGSGKEDAVYQKRNQELKLKQKQSLELADRAPRCQWVKQDGTSCGSPRMKKHIYCFAHMQMAEASTLLLMIPAAEDANAIQMGLMRIQKALIEDRISTKKAGLLLYSMQLAVTNVGQTTFGQAKDEEMVRETVDEEEAISRQQSAISQDQRHRPVTAKDAEEAKEIGTSIHRDIGSSEGQNLPRMDGDERGLKNPKPIVWKPTPDMYRMDTREGREAYEASLRRKTEPESSGEQRPIQAVAQAGAPLAQLRKEGCGSCAT